VGHIGVASYIVTWSVITFFLFHNSNSGEFKLLGLMLACFGATNVLRPCSSNSFEVRESYDTVVSMTVAVIIKVLVDVSLAASRPSEMATSTVVSGWDQVQTGMTNLFSVRVKEISFKHAAIKKIFKKAATLSCDTQMEPRLWRCPWKHEIFTEICNNGSRMTQALGVLEAVFSKTGRDGGDKSDTLTRMATDCEQVNDDFLRKVKAVKDMTHRFFSHDKCGYFASEDEAPEGLVDKHSLLKRYGEIFKGYSEVSRVRAYSMHDEDLSLESNMHCKIGTFLVCVEWMLEIMEETEARLLRQ
jgi:hypothetical protein